MASFADANVVNRVLHDGSGFMVWIGIIYGQLTQLHFINGNFHVWDTLDRRVRHSVPVPANNQQLRTAIEEEWDNIPQCTINSLINSMRRKCVALHEANGRHTRHSLVF